MAKRIEADACYYCGCGPAGEFEIHDGQPICEGCIEDYNDWAASDHSWEHDREEEHYD